MTSAQQQDDLPFNAPATLQEELTHLRRANETLETILGICWRAGYDGSTTLAEFIESRVQPK